MAHLPFMASSMPESVCGIEWIDFEEDFVIKSLYKYHRLGL
jgi:hypothetical protein